MVFGTGSERTMNQRTMNQRTIHSMKQSLGLLAVFVVFLSSARAGAGTAGSRTGNVYAVVVLVSDYQNPSVRDLPVSATLIRLLLRALTRDVGVSPDNLFLLTSTNGWATRLGILTVLADLRRRMTKNDILLLYFSGHGTSIAGYSYLLPMDFDPRRIDRTAIRHDELNQLLSTLRCRWSIVFLSACHSGFGIRNSPSRRLGPFRPSRIYGTGEGRVVIADARQDELSYVGFFPAALTTALGGMADWNGDGKITLMELWNHIRFAVPKLAQGIGKSQHPVLHASISGRIVLVDRGHRHRAIMDPRRFSPSGRIVAEGVDDSVGLYFCNRMKKKVELTFAYPVKPGSETWRLTGWFPFNPGECGRVLDKSMWGRREIAYYAQAIPRTFAILDGRLAFCVPGKAFNVTVGPNVQCRNDETLHRFRRVNLPGRGLKRKVTIDIRDPSQAYRQGLVFCNRTRKTISTAIGYHDDARRTWVAQGWWVIEPGHCKNPYIGRLDQRRYLYYFADSDSGQWGGKYRFCTLQKRFLIRGPHETCPEGQTSRGFRQIDLGPRYQGRTYILNFTP